MIIKECYISKNGISCFTNINSMHTIKNINIDSNFIFNIKSNLFIYITLRLSEFIIKDFFINQKYLMNNNTDNNFLLQAISFS